MNVPPTARSARRSRGEAVLAFLAFLAISLWYLRPIWRHAATGLAPDLGDPQFVLVVLEWGIQSIRHGFTDFWNLPIFFPATGATANSDHLFGLAAIATLLGPLLPNTIAAYNLLLLASFVGCGTTTWWVLRRAGLSGAAAFLGGCMFAFSAFRWDQLSHLQVLWMLWIPAVLWTFHRLLEEPTARRGGGFALFYALHVTGGSYLAYMIHVPLLVLLWQRGARIRHARSPRAWTVWIVTAAACAAVLAAVSWPYVLRADTHTRTAAEILEFGASLASYATASEANWYGDLSRAWRRNENTSFMGLLPAALLITALPAFWRRRRPLPAPRTDPRRLTIWTCGAIAAACFLLGEIRTWMFALYGDGFGGASEASSLHPAWLGAVLLAAAGAALGLRRRWFGDWPLALDDLSPFERAMAIWAGVCVLLAFPTIYLALRHVMPGLDGMRVPTRFFALVSFAFAWCAAHQLERWRSRLPTGRRALAATAFGALLLVDLAPRALRWEALTPKAELPPVYHWLAAAPGVTAVLELPLGDHAAYIDYMYAQTLHRKPLVGGYSGYLAPHYEALRQTCCDLVPGAADLERLRGWGVSHILVHTQDRRHRRRLSRWANRHGATLEFQENGDYVLRILPPPGASDGAAPK